MNKEKFMQLAEKAFDEGAYISIHFAQLHKDFTPVSKQEAHATAKLAQEAIKCPVTFSKNEVANSYRVIDKEKGIYIDCSFEKEVKSNAV
jgi:hypothetical protein